MGIAPAGQEKPRAEAWGWKGILRDDEEGREKYMGEEIGGEGKNVYLCGVFGYIPYYI